MVRTYPRNPALAWIRPRLMGFAALYPSNKRGGNILARWLGCSALALLLVLGGCSPQQSPQQSPPQPAQQPEECHPAWPAFAEFQSRFIDPAGKVVDFSDANQHTTSEGQAYALFFSLVANDRKLFDKILDWTGKNLVEGELTTDLPAWEWANAGDKKNSVLDTNSASDADLWLSYTLLEAGRLWDEPRYTQIGKALAEHILTSEVEDIPGLGWTLMPGRWGFIEDAVTWRLNPSYVPIPLLTYFALYLDEPRWSDVLESSKTLIAATSHGFASDWIVYRHPKGFMPDKKTNARGSYDAIRVYLWAGFIAPTDDSRAELLARLAGMRAALTELAIPPESIDTRVGKPEGQGPIGFSAALIPYLTATGDFEAAEAQRQRVRGHKPPAEPLGYYGSALSLFGLGFDEGRFAFQLDGQLATPWIEGCDP